MGTILGGVLALGVLGVLPLWFLWRVMKADAQRTWLEAEHKRVYGKNARMRR